ncbi:MAG: ABC transporter permease [Clostridia bacterium]|nr:ABC transporter permease [Clostridia bacterium]
MLRRFFADFTKYKSYVLFAARADLKSEVAGSYLNWLWWLLDPLFQMLIYMFLMLVVFNKPIRFAIIFVFLGLTMWDLFNKTLMKSSRIIKENAHILKKIRMPKFLLVLQAMYVNGFKMFISLALTGVLMVVWMIFPIDPSGRLALGWEALWFIPVLVTFFLLVFGLSLIVTHIGVYVEDLRNVLQVALKLLFYMCGIFYQLGTMGIVKTHPWIGTVLLKCNPISFLIQSARECLLYRNIYEPWWLLLWFVLAVGLVLLGIRLIYKNENTYIKVI